MKTNAEECKEFKDNISFAILLGYFTLHVLSHIQEHQANVHNFPWNVWKRHVRSYKFYYQFFHHKNISVCRTVS